MKNLFKLFLAVVLIAALAMIRPAHLRAASDKSAPEIVTNNDVKGQNTVSFLSSQGQL